MQKFDFKERVKKVFTNNIAYKLSAIFLGAALWLYLGYLNSGL